MNFEYSLIFSLVIVIGFNYCKSAFKNIALAQNFLLLCSIIYYVCLANLHDQLVLLLSILLNFYFARQVGQSKNLRIANNDKPEKFSYWIHLALASNIGLLLYYKMLGPLPLGISFYTMVQIIYLVDLHQGTLNRLSLKEHALLTVFFPTIVMGPILRAKGFIQELTTAISTGTSPFQYTTVALGLFGIGLFKKVVLADSIYQVAMIGLGAPSRLSFLESWLTAVGLTMQLYYDFSGYSDMAVALAIAMGIKIVPNFNSPLRARSISEFWTKWHVSLTSIVTTYIFTPLIRRLKKRTLINSLLISFLCMVIIGLWHGISQPYLVFGIMHGLAVCCNQISVKYKWYIPKVIGISITFIYVVTSFVFFFSKDVRSALELLSIMFNPFKGIELVLFKSYGTIQIVLPYLLGIFILTRQENSNQLLVNSDWSRFVFAKIYLAFVFSFIYMNSTVTRAFIYLEF